MYFLVIFLVYFPYVYFHNCVDFIFNSAVKLQHLQQTIPRYTITHTTHVNLQVHTKLGLGIATAYNLT